MRIAHVTDCYLPRLGGIEMQVHDLARHQIEAGDEVRVLTRTPARGAGDGLRPGGVDRPDADDSEPVPVSRLSGWVGWTGGLPSPAGPRLLAAAIRAGRFDAVHIHSSVVSPFAWTAARLASSAGIPTALTLHSMIHTRSPLLALSDSAAHWTRWPLAWSAVSEVAAAPLRELLGAGAVSVLPNGIDPAFWRVPFARATEPALTIVSVMRLSRRKRPAALIRTLAAIRDRIPAELPVRAILIGDGPQRGYLTTALRLSGMDSWVTLTGRLTRTQIRPLLAAADVYLAPAERESFGIAALEARCAGLPVVAIATSGVGQFIRDGTEGRLVGSDDEMAQVTADLLMSGDLIRMQEHNRRVPPDITWPGVRLLCEDLYDTAARIAGTRPPVYDEYHA